MQFRTIKISTIAKGMVIVGKPSFLVKIVRSGKVDVVALKSQPERERFIAHIKSRFNFIAQAVTKEELRKSQISYLLPVAPSNYEFDLEAKE